MRGKLLGADERLVIVTVSGERVVVERAGFPALYDDFDDWTQGNQGWDMVEQTADDYLNAIESGETTEDVVRETTPTTEAPPTATTAPTPQVPTQEATSSDVRVSGVVQASERVKPDWELLREQREQIEDAREPCANHGTRYNPACPTCISILAQGEAATFQLLLNWPLLRTQKAWLAAQPGDEAEGLLSLLDAIQDQAVESGDATEAEVFGEQTEEGRAERESQGPAATATPASDFDTICAAASVARSHGFAVVIFTPEELEGASVNRIQDRLVELGWEVIGDLKPQVDPVKLLDRARSNFEEEEQEESDEDDDSDTNYCVCSGENCDTSVHCDDAYFSTPCGTFCEECMGGHMKDCGICASEFAE